LGVLSIGGNGQKGPLRCLGVEEGRRITGGLVLDGITVIVAVGVTVDVGVSVTVDVGVGEFVIIGSGVAINVNIAIGRGVGELVGDAVTTAAPAKTGSEVAVLTVWVEISSVAIVPTVACLVTSTEPKKRAASVVLMAHTAVSDSKQRSRITRSRRGIPTRLLLLGWSWPNLTKIGQFTCLSV